MANTETLTQCQLHHRLPGKSTFGIDVAWIATKLAKVGLVLKFRDLEGTYEVREVYNTKPKKEVEAFERCYLHQRGVSDV
jgi:hypothetical protein